MTQELIERLRKMAKQSSEASRMMAQSKSLRQAGHLPPRDDLYMWATPEQTTEWQAADALQSQSARIAELREALQAIVDGSVFNQQRFAEDDDADYFLRCFKAAKERAQVSLNKDSTSG